MYLNETCQASRPYWLHVYIRDVPRNLLACSWSKWKSIVRGKEDILSKHGIINHPSLREYFISDQQSNTSSCLQKYVANCGIVGTNLRATPPHLTLRCHHLAVIFPFYHISRSYLTSRYSLTATMSSSHASISFLFPYRSPRHNPVPPTLASSKKLASLVSSLSTCLNFSCRFFCTWSSLVSLTAFALYVFASSTSLFIVSLASSVDSSNRYSS